MSTISINQFINKYYNKYDFEGVVFRKDPQGRRVKVALFNKYPDSAWGYKNLAPCCIRREYTYAPELGRVLYGVAIVQAS